MDVVDYRRLREATWDELRALLDRVDRGGLPSLTADELERLGALYRQAATHLAQLRTRARDRRLVPMLNDLVVRAHTQIYRAPHRPLARDVLRFYTRGFPALVRATLPCHVIAAVLTLVGLGAGFAAVRHEPDLYYAIVPASEERSPGSSPAELADALQQGRGTSAGHRSAFASFLWTHNTRVALLAFVSGVLAGVPTVVLLVVNGLMLGAMTAVYAQAGLATEWWAWVLAHGVTELSAIVIAGGGGLLLGRAVIDPGDLPRRDAIAHGARAAFALAAGAALLLLVAALLEGFFRQSEATTSTRFAVAIVTAVLWAVYFVGGARRADRRPEPAATAPRQA